MGLIGKIKKASETIDDIKRKVSGEPKQEIATIEITGFFALKEDGIMRVLEANPLFELGTKELVEKGYGGKRIYKFFPDYKYGIELIPEPENPYDKNAVAVAITGAKIGHIPRDQTLWIKKLMKSGKIINMQVEVKGGPVRKIFTDGVSMAYFNEYQPKITIEYNS